MSLDHTLLLWARVAFLAMVGCSVVFMIRWPTALRDEGGYPRGLVGILVLLMLPFVVSPLLPSWMALTAVSLQVLGFGLEWAARLRLLRANSFGINTANATQHVTSGLYHWFEHPIYVAVQLQTIGWMMFAPVAFIGFLPLFVWWRAQAQRERAYLRATFGSTHRGIDSFLWD